VLKRNAVVKFDIGKNVFKLIEEEEDEEEDVLPDEALLLLLLLFVLMMRTVLVGNTTYPNIVMVIDIQKIKNIMSVAILILGHISKKYFFFDMYVFFCVFFLKKNP
jgi:hypothetical protein